MTDIIPFNVGQMPAHLAEYMAKSSMGSLGEGTGGVRRVQLKGGQINFLGEDGKPMGIVQDEYGTVQFPQYTNSAQIIIVGMLPSDNKVYRTWYGSQYTEGSTAAPDCWSVDNVHPSPKAANPQCTACANCPKNVTGSSSTGKGKACQSRKRLAVVYAHDPAMRVFSMDLAATAMFGKSAREAEYYFTLSDYARFLKQNSTPWEVVVTEVCFSEGSNIGVRFKPTGYVPQGSLDQLLTLKDSDDGIKALTIDFAEKKKDDAAAPAYQAPVSASPALPAPSDLKAKLLADPLFQTTLATWRDWANNPAVTAQMILDAAAQQGIHFF